jgi:hypothetical protein
MHRKIGKHKILLPIMPEIIMVTVTVNITVIVITITIVTKIRDIMATQMLQASSERHTF